MNEQTTMILIDTALASGSASALDPEERTLQELVLAVRDDAPTPDLGFELRMNARVAAGFPRRGGERKGRIRTLLTTRPQLAAMGAAASLLVALIVALSAIGGGSDSSQNAASSGSASSAVAGSGTSAPGGSASSTAGGSPPPTDEAAPRSQAQSAPAQRAIAPSAGVAVPAPA